MINQILKLKKTQKEFLLNSLFKSKNFYGESLNETNKQVLPFIYGIRHKYAIINLKHTISFLKRSLNLIQSCLKKNKNILIVGDALDINFLLNRKILKKNKNIILCKNEWVNGYLTNDFISTSFQKKKINLIIYLKSDIKENYILTEMSHLKAPVIGLVNTNTNIENINYPILSNTNNLKSLFFLIYLIRKTIP